MIAPMIATFSRNTYKRGYVSLGSRPIGKFLAYLICVLMLTSSIQIPLAFGAEYLTQETTPTPNLAQESFEAVPAEEASEEGSIIDISARGARNIAGEPNMWLIGDIRHYSVILSNPNDSIVSIFWSSEYPFITISDPHALNITVEGIVEGSTLLFADVQTALGGNYRFEKRLNIYNLIAERPYGFANRNTQFYTAAHPTGNVRSPAPQNITFSVIATTGSDYFLVSPLATNPNFVFDDGDATWVNAWIPSAHVTIPVTGITLNETNLQLEANQTRQLQATITPSIATDRRVTWTSSNADIATVSATGLVTARRTGSATITVTTICGSRRATANVVVDPSPSAAPSAPRVRNINIRLDMTGRRSDGRGQNDLSFRAVSGATRYRICRQIGRTGSFSNIRTINRAQSGRVEFSHTTARLGRLYTYRVRAYNSNGQRIGEGIRRVTTGRARITRIEPRTQTSIHIRWQRVRGAQGYRIYRANSRTGTVRHIRTVNSRTFSFTDTGLRSNRNYSYKVRTVRHNLRNNAFPRSPREAERTMTLRRSTWTFMRSHAGIRTGGNVSAANMRQRSILVARTPGGIPDYRIWPPIKYHYRTSARILEIHIFIRYRTRDTLTGQSRDLNPSYHYPTQFRQGTNNFFHNREMKVRGHYRYRVRLVWHNDPSLWVANQRYITVYIGGVCPRHAPHNCNNSVLGNRWFHAYSSTPTRPGNLVFMPTREQVRVNTNLGRNTDTTNNYWRRMAAHEMGHVFGLGDGYYDWHRGGDRMTRTEQTSLRGARGMWHNMMVDQRTIDRALTNDLAMMLRAYDLAVRGYRPSEQYYRTHFDRANNRWNYRSRVITGGDGAPMPDNWPGRW